MNFSSKFPVDLAAVVNKIFSNINKCKGKNYPCTMMWRRSKVREVALNSPVLPAFSPILYNSIAEKPRKTSKSYRLQS
jgi:hypothetical protein